MNPLTPAAEALLEDWQTWLAYGHWAGCAVWQDPMTNECDCVFSSEWLRDRLTGIIVEARAPLEAEFGHFYDFVNNTDPALVDAYLFMLNNTPEAIAARRAALAVTPEPAP